MGVGGGGVERGTTTIQLDSLEKVTSSLSFNLQNKEVGSSQRLQTFSSF